MTFGWGKGAKSAKPKRKLPKTVQQSIPIEILHKDGIFQYGNIFSKTWRFSDINYKVASNAEQEEMFLAHGAILNALPTDATAKISVYNRQIQNNIFERMDAPLSEEKYKAYVIELEELLSDKMAQSNNIVHDKFVTIYSEKKNIKEARTYFARVGIDQCGYPVTSRNIALNVLEEPEFNKQVSKNISKIISHIGNARVSDCIRYIWNTACSFRLSSELQVFLFWKLIQKTTIIFVHYILKISLIIFRI